MNRINTIIKTVQKAVAGDFSSRIETSNKNDELGKLSNAINQLIALMSEQIADKKQTDTALKDSEEKYRRLQANIPGMVYLFVMHPNGSFSFPYVNDTSKDLFDISPEDLMRDATLITKLIHPDDRERFNTSVKRSAENLEPWREVLRHIVNGEVRWYDCISRPELQENGDILWDGIILEITDRRRIEEALRENEATLRSIYETSPMLMGVVELTEDDKIFHIYDNPATARFFNVEYEGTHNKAADKLGAPSEAISEWLLGYRQSQQLGKPVQFEYIHPTPDGQLWLSATVSIIGTGYNGRPRFSYVAEDITDRKRVETHLQKTVRSLINSQKLAKVGSWDWDIKTGDVVWSEEVYRIFGLDPEKFHPQIDSVMKRFHPEDRKLHESLITQEISKNESYSFETRILKPDGSTRFLISTSEGHFDENGNLLEISGTVQDITERKQSEEELSQAKAYSQKLIESANAMIVVLDSRGRVLVFNKAAEEITGYSRQEVLGYNWFEMIVPKDKYPKVWDAFLKSAHEGMPRTFENPILTKAGQELFISFQNTEVLQDGVFAGSISYGIDITKRKQLEEQLLISQKMEAIGQLAGGVAHDFNNMLSVILGHSELIKSGLPADHPLLKNILEIEKAGFHSRDITHQLLAFSRKQIIAPKTINMNQLITNTRKTLLQLIGENIDLRFIPEQDLWKVRFDPSQVDQILINLAVNARDVMPYGGKLTIETTNIYLDEVYCSSHLESRPGHYVLLMVTDDGAGMDKETLSHVFEPFFTTKEVGKGTGLGLATVYGIVKQNGGFINVYSEPEKGTTFKIYIPRIMDEVEEKRIKKSPLKSHSGTILLVEDDDMVRKMTASILEKIGYSVVTAEAPLEALELIEKGDTPIELLITDVVMPQMNGTKLYEKIKMIKPGINVLFMSGYTENVIVHHGVLKEDVHFVQKPFSMNVFAQKVRDAMENN